MAGQLKCFRTLACAVFLVTTVAASQESAVSPQNSPVASQAAPGTEATRTTPRDRLVYASEQSSLETLNAKPWHLKLQVTTYDEKGQNPQSGTIERWQTSDAKLTEFNFGTATLRTLKTKDGEFRTEADASVPVLAETAFEQFLHPGAPVEEVDEADIVVQKIKFGSIDLDCVMLSQKLHGSRPLPFGSSRPIVFREVKTSFERPIFLVAKH